ncbi:MAG: DUF3100 domain-containing protein [Anaerolineae bacterium]
MTAKRESRSAIAELFAPPLIKMYLIALVLVIIAEFIGTVRWTPVAKITILLVPFFHTIYLAVAFAPQLLGRWVKLYSLEDSAWAAGIIVTATYPLMARYGTLVGPNVPKLLQAGLALILQEIGNNWGSIAIALPIGILLGLRREVIGACYSVAREPNLSLIGDIYGLDSPEGRGVLGTYITGTVLGTAFFSILGSLFAATAPAIFHPLALGMAMGIGSASMMTAGSATLAEALPAYKDQILAFAAASNLITGVTGLYASWLVGIPFAEWVYRLLGKRREQVAAAAQATVKQVRPKIKVGWTMFHVTLISLLVLIGNWVATKVPPWDAFIGMLLLWLMVLVGVLLARYVPVFVPTIAYIGTLALIVTMPGFPGSVQILEFVKKVNFLALATPIIAFTSLSIAKDLSTFAKMGWRIVVAALITLFSVFFSAAVIAEIILRIQGFPR